MEIKSYIKVAQAIKKAKKIALCIHMFPDGDAIGSMIALALALKGLRKKIYLFSPSELPHRYKFLPFYDQIKTSSKGSGGFDLAIAIDCASQVQLGEFYKKVFGKAKQTVEIDHHVFREVFADISLVDDKAAAVGEIIYHLCKALDKKIDKVIAVPLLVSIIVETGSFRLPSVHAETFRICSELIALGVNYYKVVENSYWSRTRAEAMLLGLCFSRLKFLKGEKVAMTTITFGDLKRLGAREEDVDPVADQIRTLKNVQVVLLFREMHGLKWRVSLRSKGLINVGKVAEEFGGGGHPDVAGCYLPKREKEKKRLISSVLKLL
jgi:phosphoesterase RecJ-like protein